MDLFELAISDFLISDNVFTTKILDQIYTGTTWPPDEGIMHGEPPSPLPGHYVKCLPETNSMNATNPNTPHATNPPVSPAQLPNLRFHADIAVRVGQQGLDRDQHLQTKLTKLSNTKLSLVCISSVGVFVPW